MRTKKPQPRSRKAHKRNQLNIGISEEIRERLDKVVGSNDELDSATLARVGLRYTLDQLESGTHAIVNGKLMPITGKPAAK